MKPTTKYLLDISKRFRPQKSKLASSGVKSAISRKRNAIAKTLKAGRKEYPKSAHRQQIMRNHNAMLKPPKGYQKTLFTSGTGNLSTR